MVRRWVAAAAAAAGLLLATSGAGADAAADAPRWRWPVSPPRIVAPWVAPAGPYAAGHRGIDLAAAPGDPVIAPAPGVVTFSGVVVDRPVVTVQVGDGVMVSMEPVVAEVARGASVAAGQPLGSVGHGGHCDTACVHVGVRVDGAYVSPLRFFAEVPPAVLLPLD
jgi:murein DD-endopeptidase MepM/ murein hydrolase activator NlpD